MVQMTVLDLLKSAKIDFMKNQSARKVGSYTVWNIQSKIPIRLPKSVAFLNFLVTSVNVEKAGKSNDFL